MTIDTVTGIISWTAGIPNSYSVKVEAHNGVNPAAQQSYTINVTGTAPAITSTAVTTGIVGQVYTYDVNASGNPQPSI